MIGRIILAWLATGGLVWFGYRLGRAGAQVQAIIDETLERRDLDHESCQAREGQLLAALNREVANVHRLDRFVFAQLEYIEEVKRDLADRGVTVAGELEEFVADREGLS